LYFKLHRFYLLLLAEAPVLVLSLLDVEVKEDLEEEVGFQCPFPAVMVEVVMVAMVEVAMVEVVMVEVVMVEVVMVEVVMAEEVKAEEVKVEVVKVEVVKVEVVKVVKAEELVEKYQ
jgi:hypothetical protein